MQKIKKVCVIGSGVMGSGIAAQIANSRTDVVLLDIVDKKSVDASSIPRNAVKLMHKQRPPLLSYPYLEHYIQIGNLRDDLAKISQCDLIIEAIIEKLEIKHTLYESLLPYLKKDAIIASNTSTLSLSELKKTLPGKIQERFIITHFFNPPRYMELLELVTDNNTSTTVADDVSDFISIRLGKTIVKCNDTPGFIANRIGCFMLELVVREAVRKELNPVKIDRIFSNLLGFPGTGIFGLYDLIGHDVMHLISDSLKNSLPADDKYHAICQDLPLLNQMRLKGFLGRKSGSGFYKLVKQKGKPIKKVINFKTVRYHKIPPANIPVTLKQLLEKDDEYTEFFQKTLNTFFNYVIGLIPDVSDNIEDIDKAMRLGYNLKYGPFELLENLPSVLIQLPSNSILQGTKTQRKSAWYETKKNILENDSARLIKYKNQHVFIINTKMNLLNHEVFNLLIDSVKRSEDEGKNLYIFQAKAAHFSAGADIKFFYENIMAQNFKTIEEFIELGQNAMMTLKYAKINIISCAHGMALGGGCELLLHSDLVIAHQNLNAGLVELGVGLIPGWGGVKEMFLRSEGKQSQLLQNLSNILLQNKSSSGDYFAKNYNTNCQINMNKEFILEQALHTKIQKMSKPASVKLPKINLSQALDTTNFDQLQFNIMEFFQKIINLGTIDEKTLLSLEKEKFLELAATPSCLERLGTFIKARS